MLNKRCPRICSSTARIQCGITKVKNVQLRWLLATDAVFFGGNFSGIGVSVDAVPTPIRTRRRSVLGIIRCVRIDHAANRIPSNLVPSIGSTAARTAMKPSGQADQAESCLDERANPRSSRHVCSVQVTGVQTSCVTAWRILLQAVMCKILFSK